MIQIKMVMNTKLSTTNHVEAMWIEAIVWSYGKVMTNQSCSRMVFVVQ